MVDFINATQARGEIERIISKAKFNIIMISPYIKINDDFISRLNDAGLRKVKTLMVCRNEDLRPGEREKLEQIPNLELRFHERVHAKCFYNEDTMVISSLNLYDSSFGDNREMGVLLRSSAEGDKEVFADAKNEAQFIIRECQIEVSKSKPAVNERNQISKANVVYKPKIETKPVKEPRIEDVIVNKLSSFLGISGKEDDSGHCIHCGKDIPFNLEAPYCPNCYRTWARYKDDNYREKYCVKCGKSEETSMKHPLCSTCTRKTN
jgi:hypothetical protein